MPGFDNFAFGRSAHSLPREITGGLMSSSSHVEWTYLGFGKRVPGSIHSSLRICCRTAWSQHPQLRMRLRPCQIPFNGLCFPRRIKSSNSSSFWLLAVIFPPGTAAKKPVSDLITFRKCAIWLVIQCGLGWQPLLLQTPPGMSHRLNSQLAHGKSGHASFSITGCWAPPGNFGATPSLT